MSKDIQYRRITDRRVEIENTGGHYEARIQGHKPYRGGAVNIAGRAAGLAPGAILELGGGDTEVVIEGRKDTRLKPNTLICVGFKDTVIL
jgi:hypothetical protein